MLRRPAAASTVAAGARSPPAAAPAPRPRQRGGPLGAAAGGAAAGAAARVPRRPQGERGRRGGPGASSAACAAASCRARPAAADPAAPALGLAGPQRAGARGHGRGLRTGRGRLHEAEERAAAELGRRTPLLEALLGVSAGREEAPQVRVAGAAPPGPAGRPVPGHHR